MQKSVTRLQRRRLIYVFKISISVFNRTVITVPKVSEKEVQTKIKKCFTPME